jgi:hypothetical protein
VVTLDGRPWLQTHSGRAWCADAPADYAYDIREIAYALSNINRFCGHVGTYSVAEHSVRVAELFLEWNDSLSGAPVRAALLHDAAEAFCADLPAPLKSMPQLAGYVDVIRSTELAISEHFGLTSTFVVWRNEIRQADLGMLAIERQTLLSDALAEHWQWLPDVPQYEAFVPWSPAKAEREFLASWRRYGGEL